MEGLEHITVIRNERRCFLRPHRLILVLLVMSPLAHGQNQFKPDAMTTARPATGCQLFAQY
jgi:hypothetical protein